MKILQVITDTDRRGAQVFAVDLGKAMETAGHKVRTVALANGEQSPRLHVEALGAKRMGFDTLWRLRELMSEVDVTVAHGSTTGPACAIAGVGPGRPFVYRQISDSRFWANTWRRRLRVAAFVRASRAVVALSGEAKRTLAEHVWADQGRISVIPNGVPIGEFHPPSEAERSAARAALGLESEDTVVGYVGALVPEKGVEDLVRATGSSAMLSLIVAGDGDQRSELEGQANDRTHFVGAVSDPMRVYAALDVVALPSRGGDSMPAGLIEAGFCELPAVATPVGSIEEIVVDGVTGIIVPCASADRLRGALEHYAENPEVRRRHGAEGGARCRSRFEIGVVAALWLELLASIDVPPVRVTPSPHHPDGCVPP